MKDLRVEAFSLNEVRIQDSSIVMSKAEVRATIEHVSGQKMSEKELRLLPGTDKPSIFLRCFETEDETEDEP